MNDNTSHNSIHRALFNNEVAKFGMFRKMGTDSVLLDSFSLDVHLSAQVFSSMQSYDLGCSYGGGQDMASVFNDAGLSFISASTKKSMTSQNRQGTPSISESRKYLSHQIVPVTPGWFKQLLLMDLHKHSTSQIYTPGLKWTLWHVLCITVDTMFSQVWAVTITSGDAGAPWIDRKSVV